jgi:hypothetical protein
MTAGRVDALAAEQLRTRAAELAHVLRRAAHLAEQIAELVTEGQRSGENATRADGTAIRDHVRSQDKVPATLADLGITRQRRAGWPFK